MKHTKKPLGARLMGLLLVLSFLPGMITVSNAAKGDYEKWKKDYDAYGYDPYEEYYEEWDIPSVQEIYKKNGESAADSYVGLLRRAATTGNNTSVLTFVENVDTQNPPATHTADPTAGWTATNDPYISLYKSLGLPTFGEVEQTYGRGYAVQWRQITEQLDRDAKDEDRDRMLPTYWDMLKEQYEATQTPPPEESEKPYIPPVDHESETIDGIDYEDYIKEHPDYKYDYNQGTDDNQSAKTEYFPDVPSDAWYAEAVNAMAATGLIHGYEDGTFRPENTLTQGEWATIVWNIVGGYTAPDAAEETIYLWNADGKKVPAGHWASIMLYYAGQKYKYLPGVYPTVDGSAEEAPASRLLAVHSIVWMLEAQNCRSESYRNMNAAQNNLADKLLARQKKNGEKVWTLDDIPDHDLIPEQPENFVGLTGQEVAVKAYNYGVIHGMDEAGTFNAEGHLTRAEACQMLYNALITEPRPIRGDTGGAYGS